MVEGVGWGEVGARSAAGASAAEKEKAARGGTRRGAPLAKLSGASMAARCQFTTRNPDATDPQGDGWGGGDGGEGGWGGYDEYGGSEGGAEGGDVLCKVEAFWQSSLALPISVDATKNMYVCTF